jgi:hypothetical protein
LQDGQRYFYCLDCFGAEQLTEAGAPCFNLALVR